jgi:hypothetical protein
MVERSGLIPDRAEFVVFVTALSKTAPVSNSLLPNMYNRILSQGKAPGE